LETYATVLWTTTDQTSLASFSFRYGSAIDQELSI
jgi:hypothetical protein